MLSLVMAGGVGERFWPLSRRNRPKQLLDLTGKGSMIRLTVERLKAFSDPRQIFIVTNESQYELLRKEVPSIPPENVIAEPVGRNTAPCIGLSCLLMKKRFGGGIVLVLPSDHVIGRLDRFKMAVDIGERYISRCDELLTFGIPPSRPETGYGYIRVGEKLFEGEGLAVLRSEAFLEKPDSEKAKVFYKKKNYLWNSGMFLWKIETILGAIERYLPELSSLLGEIESQLGTKELSEVLKGVYHRAPSISIDYGVMEKADGVAVLRGDFEWNDVGNWESIRDLYRSNGEGNVLVGKSITVDSSDNTVFSPERFVGLIGVDDVVVVNGENATLVCKRSRVQEVKKIVKALRDRGVDELT